MKPILIKDVFDQGQRIQLVLPHLVRATILDTVLGARMSALTALLEEERAELWGPRYAHDPERRASRAGYAKSELAMGGRRVSVNRPRARNEEGEVPLRSWEHFSEQDPLTPRAVEQAMIGVATRKYARSLEPMPASIASRRVAPARAR